MTRDLVILGSPSPIMSWIEAVVRALAGLQQPQARIAVVKFTSPEIADLGRPVRREGLVALVDEPPAWMVRRIRSGDLAAILVIEDPRVAVAHVQRISERGLLDALRTQSALSAAAPELRAAPQLRVLTQSPGLEARALAREFVIAWGLDPDAPAVATALNRLAGAAPARRLLTDILAIRAANAPQPAARAGSEETAEAVDALDHERRDAIIGGAVDPLVELFYRGDAGPVEWPRELLLDGDDFVRPAQRDIDLTGPARNLVRGPYLCLPPGHYQCRYETWFSAEAVDARFALEVHGKVLLGRYLFKPRRSGRQALDFAFDIDAPDHWIDMRFRLEEGMIDGHAAAQRVILTRTGDPAIAPRGGAESDADGGMVGAGAAADEF